MVLSFLLRKKKKKDVVTKKGQSLLKILLKTSKTG